MHIKYKTNKVEEICTNLKKAQKQLSQKIHAEKLIANINFIKSAKNFLDIIKYVPFHTHMLSTGKFALDVNGRKCSYRMIIYPLDENGNRITADENFASKAKSIEVVMVEEVSNHYE